MSNPLLERVLPAEAAGRSQVFDYKGKVEDFDRLVGILEADLGTLEEADRPREWRAAPIEIRLDFAWANTGKGIPAVTGRVEARLAVVCQRCLAAFDLPVETSFSLLFQAPDEDAADLAGLAEVDIWELEAETVRPVDLVEELLIMAMPLAPMHEAQESCGILPIAEEDNGSETVRPFADLRSQMEKMNS
jgi:uncharacterized metal-binding protein YceD (DUF177 family)